MKYVVWVSGTRPVTAEVVVEAHDEDEAKDKAAELVERDHYQDITWDDTSGAVIYEDIDDVEEADEDAELTRVRVARRVRR